MNGRKQLSMTIQVNSRLHLSLISMHESGYRKNGGFGFSIKSPYLLISGERSSSFELTDLRERGFREGERGNLVDLLCSIFEKKNFLNKCTIEIKGDMPSHMGFGSGTSIRLACIELLHLLNNSSYTNSEIVKESLRGGTSGIGVNTYFDGGFVFDIGHSEAVDKFLPSNAVEKTNHLLPLVVTQENMPNWEIGICVPDNISSISKEKEKDFFQSTCPIKPHESYESLYHIVFGLLGAAKEKNLEVFAESLRSLQKCKWKNSERNLYKGAIEDIEEKLYRSGALGVGMSSLGPSLVFVGYDIDEIIKKTQKLLPSCSFLKSKIANTGRQIIHDV